MIYEALYIKVLNILQDFLSHFFHPPRTLQQTRPDKVLTVTVAVVCITSQPAHKGAALLQRFIQAERKEEEAVLCPEPDCSVMA